MNQRDTKGRTMKMIRTMGRETGVVVEMSFTAAVNAYKQGFATPAPGTVMPPDVVNQTIAPEVGTSASAVGKRPASERAAASAAKRARGAIQG